LGLLTFFAVPLLPFFETTEITPETFRWTAIASLFLMPVFIYLCVKWTPNGRRPLAANQSSGKRHVGEKRNYRVLLKAFINNKPFLIFLVAYIFIYAGTTMWYGTIFIYVDAYLGAGDHFAGAFMISFAISIALIPIWYKVIMRLGKRVSWGIGVLFFVAAYVYTALLEPGNVDLVKLVTLKLLTDCGYVCVGILAPSMLSDIVDYSTWKFRVDLDATYFSVYILVLKIFTALGAASGLAIAAWYGVDPASATVTENAAFGLRLATAWLPALLVLISLVFIFFSPITNRRHDIIRRRLEARVSHESG